MRASLGRTLTLFALAFALSCTSVNTSHPGGQRSSAGDQPSDSTGPGSDGGGDTGWGDDREGGVAGWGGTGGTEAGDGQGIVEFRDAQQDPEFPIPEWLVGDTRWVMGTALWLPRPDPSSEVEVWILENSGLRRAPSWESLRLAAWTSPFYCEPYAVEAELLVATMREGGTAAEHCDAVSRFIRATSPSMLAPERRNSIVAFWPELSDLSTVGSGEYTEQELGPVYFEWATFNAGARWDLDSCEFQRLGDLQFGYFSSQDISYELELSEAELEIRASGLLQTYQVDLAKFSLGLNARRCSEHRSIVVAIVGP